jgi:sulfoxide reductase heme-binding subunit YedZ
LVKKDLTEPFYYAAVLVLLLGIRVYYKHKASLQTTEAKDNVKTNVRIAD